MPKKRKISMKAIEAAIRSPRTPKHLKEGLIRKYGHRFSSNPKISKEFLEWWRRQRHSTIMRPSTFERIKEKAKKAGYRDPSAVAGEAYWKTAMAKYRRSLTRRTKKGRKSSVDTKRKNPRPVEIYDRILRIEAQKGDNSLYPKEEFFHEFTGKNAKAKVLGLPDGSLLIKGRKPLWKEIKQ